MVWMLWGTLLVASGFTWIVMKVYLTVSLRKEVPNPKKCTECVLITGCDSGIGRNTALRFLKEGFTVFACCFSESAFPSLQEDSAIHSNGSLVLFCVDIRSNDSVQKLGRDIKIELNKNNRRLFAVVNNAGVLTNGPIEMQPIESISFQIEVNVLGQIRVIQETLPFIRESKGRIINIVSIAGRVTTDSMGAYSASKHAMEAITDALRGELKPWNVSVSAIEPGIIDTGLARSAADNERIWNHLKPGAKEVYKKLYKDTKRLGKMGLVGISVECVSDAILHATTSRFPKTRYLVGSDARGLAFLKWCCSDTLFDTFSAFAPAYSSFAYKIKNR